MAIFRNLSIRHKLILIVALASAAALLFSASIMLIREWISYRNELVDVTHSQAKLLSANCANALLLNNKKAAMETLATFSGIGNIIFAMLHDKDGEPFAIYVRAGEKPPPHHIARYNHTYGYRISATQLNYFYPIKVKGEFVGTVHVRSDLSPLYEHVAWGAVTIFAATLLGLGMAMALVMRLHPAITGSIESLVHLMGIVSREKKYDLRAEVDSSDELGMLAAGFNDMLERVQQRDAELVRHRASLQGEVAERTAELENANRDLAGELAERVRAEAALKESEEKFHTIFDKALDGILLADVETKRLLNGNERMCAMLGYSLDEIQHLKVDDIHPEADMPIIREEFERQALGELSGREAIPMKRKDGTVFYADLSSSPVTIGGRACLVGVFRDITERMQAEEKLREGEARYRSIFETVDDVIYQLRPDGTFSSINPAFERITGWTVDEWIGKSFAGIIHPDDLPFANGVFEKAMSGESVPTFRLRVARKSGSYFDAELSISPLGGSNKAGALGIARDISERKQMEERIQKLNEELEIKVQERTRQLLEAQEELVRKEKFSTLGQVAGSVGHELRNPLGVMSNAVYFLQTVLSESDATTKEYLGIIKDEVVNADRIVSDLLDSVRTKPPQVEPVIIRTLMEQTLRKITVPAGINVTLDFPVTPAPVLVDPRQVEQVFRNLIANAIDAMAEGGNLDISATEDEARQNLVVKVKDSGIGITVENRAMLFQPLFTTKARGIGLGLVVVKNLTENNGGTVAVESEPGKGTTFSVTLPLVGDPGQSHWDVK